MLYTYILIDKNDIIYAETYNPSKESVGEFIHRMNKSQDKIITRGFYKDIQKEVNFWRLNYKF
jgi:hypothetical protein